MKKVAIITGASKGIGFAIASEFKKNGFYIVNIARSNSKIADINIQCDLSKVDDISIAISKLISKIDNIDVLINNAGVGLYESWEDMSIEDLKYVFEVNFFAPVYLTKGLIQLLKKSNGTIINISSVAGKIYVPYMGGYCATKFALNAFSNSLRAELMKYNINVLNVIVGRINTGFSKKALGRKNPPNSPTLGASKEKLAKKIYKSYLKNKREIIYPYWYKPVIYLIKTFPYLYDRFSVKKWDD